MTDTFHRARTETFEHTISGLLTKRAEMFREADAIRERLAEIRNDMSALDRVLESLGYPREQLDSLMPRQKRTVIIGSGEAARMVMSILRTASEPLSTREVAIRLMQSCGQDHRDRKTVTDRTSRVSRVLRRLRDRGVAVGLPQPEGILLWKRAEIAMGAGPLLGDKAAI
jgi:hypothetical protein